MEDVYNLEAMAACDNYNSAIYNWVYSATRNCSSVLDFGAGRGTIANLFNRSIACLELDRKLLLEIKSSHLKINSLDEISDNTFDCIYSINVFEHISDDAEVATKLVSKLKDGGKLLLFVPARMELYSSMDKRVGHIRRYDWHSIESLAVNAGCKIESIKYFDSLGYLASLGLRAVGRFGWNGKLNKTGTGFYDSTLFPLSRVMDKAFSKIIGKNLMLEATKKTF